MPQYKVTGHDRSGKTKTVKVTAHNAEDAELTAATENKGFVFKDAELLKGEITIKGPFVFRTFVVAAASSGYSEDEAKGILNGLIKSGKVVEITGGCGMNGETKIFEAVKD